MGQSGFAQNFVNAMLGWIRGLAGGIASLFQSTGSSRPSFGASSLTWFADNWLKLLVVLILVGILVDWIVWMLRWRPYWLWFRKRRVVLDDDVDERPRPRGERVRFHSTALRRDEPEDGEPYDEDLTYEEYVARADDLQGDDAWDGDADGEDADDGEAREPDDRAARRPKKRADRRRVEYADELIYEDAPKRAESPETQPEDECEAPAQPRDADLARENDEYAEADIEIPARRKRDRSKHRRLFDKRRAAVEDEDPFEADFDGLDEDEEFYAALTEPRKPLSEDGYRMFSRPAAREEPEEEPEIAQAEPQEEPEEAQAEPEQASAAALADTAPREESADAAPLPVSGTARSRKARRMSRQEEDDD